MTTESYALFVTCPSGVENLLKVELEQLGLAQLRETVTGVLCEGDMRDAYRVCLRSRLANRVLLLLASTSGGNAHHISDVANAIAWEQHLPEGATIKVDFSGTTDAIRNSQYGAQLVKDAIVDRMQMSGQRRPDVDLTHPDLRINVRLTKRKLYISLDLSGDSLHRRAYRAGQGVAPIKENLAAALLMRARWPMFIENQESFVDPMCGSGTFLIEAAMMALNIAPALLRTEFGFLRWKRFDAALWQTLVDQAQAEKQQAIAESHIRYTGYEKNPRVAEQARENIERAGLAGLIDVVSGDIEQAQARQQSSQQSGLILCNPPYGMRMGEVDQLAHDYHKLALECKARFSGWTLGILSSNPQLLSETRMRADKKYKVLNGPIECELRMYHIRADADDELKLEKRGQPEPSGEVLNEAAQMVANRIQKNKKRLKSWLTQHQIECYRVYDADIPEYSAAIDVYRDRLHIQEYQAPKTVDAHKSAQRFRDIIAAAKHVFNVERSKVYVKVRKKNKGSAQYQKHSDLNLDECLQVQEGDARLLVNLQSYLDTGLFLDHRPLRLHLAKQCQGKRFLNLFCYTASASVHAILGGASHSVSVDMSNTYTQWAAQNFKQNNIRSSKHAIVREDVFTWLKNCREGFDVIMLDPPSFSNSKRMEGNFDVQRDHATIVSRCMDILNKGGVLYFSNNYRKFKIDEALSKKFVVEDITASSIDKDFERNPKIHHCFTLRHR